MQPNDQKAIAYYSASAAALDMELVRKLTIGEQAILLELLRGPEYTHERVLDLPA